MSHPSLSQPKPRQNNKRSWWRKKRYLIPGGMIIAIGALNPGLDRSPSTVGAPISAPTVVNLKSAPSSQAPQTGNESERTVPPQTSITTAPQPVAAPQKKTEPAKDQPARKQPVAAAPQAPAPVAAEPQKRQAAAKKAETVAKQKKKPHSATGGSDQRSSGGYFKNCAAAKAAGAAPLRRGHPGYSRALDRDGDGIACER